MVMPLVTNVRGVQHGPSIKTTKHGWSARSTLYRPNAYQRGRSHQRFLPIDFEALNPGAEALPPTEGAEWPRGLSMSKLEFPIRQIGRDRMKAGSAL